MSVRSWVGRADAVRVRVNLVDGEPRVVRAGTEIARGWPTDWVEGAWVWASLTVVPIGAPVRSALRWSERDGVRVDGGTLVSSPAVALLDDGPPTLFPRSSRSGRGRRVDGFSVAGDPVQFEVELVKAGGCGCGGGR